MTPMTTTSSLRAPFRLAHGGEADRLAELVNFAGEGLPHYVWTQMCEADADPWEIGRARQSERAQKGQIVVVDLGEGAVAGLTGYPIGSEPVPVGADTPAIFRPLQELENLAPNSWYVNVLACYPDHRGKGYGSMLLGLAEEIAAGQGLEDMSMIVADTNAGARRLYGRIGYREAASRPCIREGWKTDIRNWILLTKPLAAPRQ